MFELAVHTAVVVDAYMTVAFLIAIALRRNDFADVAWGLGFAVIAWFVALGPGAAASPRGLLVAVLVTVWGVRLAVHIGRRGFSAGGSEDPRYAAWRLQWGRWFLLRTYLQVFMLQGVFMWLVALPVMAVGASAGGRLGVVDALGAGLWATGLMLETRADAQLARWLAEPAHRGRPRTTGVWAWTRHPNYLGDALVWWGIAVIALSVPGGLIGIVGAAVMTLLLRYVSGVPLLEKRHMGEPEWDAYRARTPIFLPRPPRR